MCEFCNPIGGFSETGRGTCRYFLHNIGYDSYKSKDEDPDDVKEVKDKIYNKVTKYPFHTPEIKGFIRYLRETKDGPVLPNIIVYFCENTDKNGKEIPALVRTYSQHARIHYCPMCGEKLD